MIEFTDYDSIMKFIEAKHDGDENLYASLQ